MILETRAVAPFYKNGFVLGCERTREGVLIDPGDEVDDLLAAAFEADVQIQRILLTHAHVDHVTGVAAAKEALDVPVYLHKDDLFLYEQAVEHGRMFGRSRRSTSSTTAPRSGLATTACPFFTPRGTVPAACA
jgi:glyoxylase-like metal-dependent hydrolase (beta-lactamase superfamily II)